MKLEHLTLGDWVEVEGQPHQVTGVTRVEGEAVIQTDINKTYYYGDSYKPIKLTPKILKLNNFKEELSDDKVHNRYFFQEGKITFSLIYFNDLSRWLGVMNIRFVHELQHLMRLCQLSKKITLKF